MTPLEPLSAFDLRPDASPLDVLLSIGWRPPVGPQHPDDIVRRCDVCDEDTSIGRTAAASEDAHTGPIVTLCQTCGYLHATHHGLGPGPTKTITANTRRMIEVVERCGGLLDYVEPGAKSDAPHESPGSQQLAGLLLRLRASGYAGEEQTFAVAWAATQSISRLFERAKPGTKTDEVFTPDGFAGPDLMAVLFPAARKPTEEAAK